ncbi:MAG: hypothetical protein H6727_12495 [Myxococcales bacterium]|nr:hypothetical protein [Myxococcales bacterium]
MSYPSALGVLVRFRQQAPTTVPEPILAMAQWCEQHQLHLLYGTPSQVSFEQGHLFLEGWCVSPQDRTWQSAPKVPLIAIYNRFPHSADPAGLEQAEALAADVVGIPFGNPISFQSLVQDKWLTYLAWRDAGLPTPETQQATQTPPLEKLKSWGLSFFKPRYGAFGEGISCIKHTKRIWQIQGEDTQALQSDEAFVAWWQKRLQQGSFLIQRGVPNYTHDLAGASIRTLLQRVPCVEGNVTDVWKAAPRVIRTSTSDPIANAARGAKVAPLETLWSEQFGKSGSRALLGVLSHLEQRAIQALTKQKILRRPKQILEVGLDLLLDPKGEPYLLEANGFPQGRLEKLAELDPSRFAEAMKQVQLHPLSQLLQLTQATRKDFA